MLVHNIQFVGNMFFKHWRASP